ncbi:MAG: Spy/CpxP family protein refolding chaperone [Betaproteobacteria bacterium]|nr:Spy/CpxP family protein refolding chaperone [Betaproteobacteria bacterium]
MKKTLLAGLTVLSLTASAAFAQQGYYPPCWGYDCGMMGPGMMGGYGMMGPGMVGGYGMMGPGMMGPGMMEGYGGYGPGYGMGPGMMGGYGSGGPYAGLNLTKEQQEKIGKIRDDLARKEAPLMQQIAEERNKLQQMYYSGADPAALDQEYKKMMDLQRQAFDARTDAQKRMSVVLTKEQRESMRRMWRGGGQGYGPGM